MKKMQNGFTLLELLIVVAIIGFLSMVALPAYRDYVIRGQLTEATTTLASLRVNLEQYFQDHTNYGSTAAACGVAMPAGKYFAYTCNWGAGGTPQFYTITATGIAGEGTEGFAFTINQDNTKSTVMTASAWGSGTNSCWINRKGDSC